MAIKARGLRCDGDYNGMLTLWQELDLCYDYDWDCTSDSARHMKREENDRVYVFLARKPLPNIREVFCEVRREEARRRVMLKDANQKPTTESESSALASRGIKHEGDKQNNKRSEKPWCDISSLGTQERLTGRWMASHKI